MDTKMIGKWVFVAGFVLAVVAAFVPSLTWLTLVLVLLGVLGGWFRVSKESETGFFVLTLALAAFQGAYAAVPFVGGYLTAIFGAFMPFMAAVALTVIVRNFVGWFK